MNKVNIRTIELKPAEAGFVKVAVKYETVNEGGYVKSTHFFESDNFDSKKLRERMYDLSEELRSLCELPIDLEKQVFSVRKIMLGQHEKKEKTYQFVCMMGLNESHDAIQIKTPKFYSASKLVFENLNDNLQILIDEVRLEAESFILKTGVQLELFIK